MHRAEPLAKEASAFESEEGKGPAGPMGRDTMISTFSHVDVTIQIGGVSG